jgi:hypothetical protein
MSSYLVENCRVKSYFVVLVMILMCMIFGFLGPCSAYEPTLAVKAAHNIPRITPSFTTGPNNFNGTDIQSTYFKSLAVFPIILCAVGITSILLFLLVLMTRCCCYCSNCGPVPTKDAEEFYEKEQYEMWATRIISRRRWYLVFAAFFIILGLLADHTQFFGNKYMKRGVQKGTTSLSTLADYFQIVDDDSSGIVVASNSINTAFESTTCAFVQANIDSYTGTIDEVQSYATSIEDLVNDIPNTLNRVRHLLQYYGVYIQFIVVISIYAVVAFTFAFFILGLVTKNAIISRLGIGSSVIIVTILTVLCPLVMIVVVSTLTNKPNI